MGRYRSAASRKAYNRLITEWQEAQAALEDAGLTVVELVAQYTEHAKVYYRKPDGTQTAR